MTRFADAFIALCILVVSTSAGAVLRFQWGLEWRDALAAGGALGCALFLLQFWRGRSQARQASEIDVLSERIDMMRGEIDSMARRVAQVEGDVSRRIRSELDPVVAEVEVIGSLLRQMAETLAEIETQRRQPVPAAAPAPERPPEAGRSAARPAQAKPAPLPLPARFADLGEKGLLDLVRRAIEAGRIDLYLQPIVSLPQRKVRFYECFSRLRTEDGDTIYPSDYIELAERRGLMADLDHQVLLRSVHILRRLAGRAQDIGIFCNISAGSLSSPVFFKEIMAFMDANRALAGVLVFEVSQRAVKAMGPTEFEALSALAEMGFRFSVDQVTDLKAGFTHLQTRGFRYVKVPASRMLARNPELDGDIHAADLASHFARFGLDLIVDHIEAEAEVVDLLDINVRYGQGFLFSPPRPVRNEMTQEAGPTLAAVPTGPPPAQSEARPSLPAPRILADDPRRRGPVGRAIAARQ